MGNSSVAFQMPESINGEEAPATVPFVQPGSGQAASDQQQVAAAINHQQFASLADAKRSYEAWASTCNWKRPPSLARFVWASEHNWGEDGLRIPESDSENYYDYAGWEEDMQAKNDDRWFMDADNLLAEYTDTMEDGEPVDSVSKTDAANDPAPASDAADNTGTASDEHDEKFWQEMEILAQLRTAEIARQEAQTAFDIATEERKEAKEHLASCAATVARITAKLVGLNNLPGASGAKPVPTAKSTEPSSQPSSAAAADEKQTQSPQQKPEDDSWRKEPTENIIKGLKGLGQKKLEAICELAPTVGELEDLRGQASAKHQSFKEVLPDRCGEAIAQLIEDALLDFMYKWKPREEEKQAAEAPSTETPTSEQADTKPADDLADL